MRSDGRAFDRGRCLVLADGFYEYTTPTNPKQKRKDRWLFQHSGTAPYAIAGLLRDAPAVGEAFTLLTMPPGPDLAGYHDRQIALLPPAAWRPWLVGSAAAASNLLRTLPAGSLRVTTA